MYKKSPCTTSVLTTASVLTTQPSPIALPTTTASELTTSSVLHQVCQHVNCTADFDRCSNFDETVCSGCDVSFEHPQDVVLKDRVTPLSFPLDGVHKPCNDMRISFTLTTDATFSTSTLYRNIFKLS